MSAFRLRIPIHGVALFESDFMIALGKRQGDCQGQCESIGSVEQ
jgi:hypothetical protein